MELIIIRHGEAEEAQADLADERRNLTDQGQKRLRKGLPALLAYLDDTCTPVIWTSPMNRATQTADILAELLIKNGLIKTTVGKISPSKTNANKTNTDQTNANKTKTGKNKAGKNVWDLHDELATGDFAVLIHETRSLDPATTLILIGHEPFCSRWSERLCGLALPFRKGAAAGFDFDPITWDLMGNGETLWQGRGQLLWFLQPKIQRRLLK